MDLRLASMGRRQCAVVLIALTACVGPAERFSPAGSGFSVHMPPPEPPAVSDGPLGAAAQSLHNWCNSAGRSLPAGLWRRAVSQPAYCVGYYDLPSPPTDADPVFAQLRDAQAEALGSVLAPGSVRVEKDESIVLRGMSGREFRLATVSGHTFLGRAFIVRHRVYHLWVQGKPREVESNAATKFLESFALTE